MRYIELEPLPNDGFVVASNFYGIINEKILLGGGSGFKTPLAEGGKKLLSNRVMLVSESDGKWIVHDQVGLIQNGEAYGFCNGASIVIDDIAYFIGGFKTLNQKMVDSADIVKVWVAPNNKINYQIYEDILPFHGKAVGLKTSSNQAMIICGDKIWNLQISHDEKNVTNFSTTLLDTGKNLINGTLPAASNGTVYLFGGYVGFDVSKKHSNYFVVDHFQTICKTRIHREPLANNCDHPYTFLDGGALWKNDHELLLIGGVNAAMFVDAVKNLSTLKGDELANYRATYFKKSEEEFNFNRDLLLFDTNIKQLRCLGKFNHGFAGNPVFVKLNESYYILSSEVKAGVRLTHPIKFTL